MANLFSPGTLGSLSIPNRVIMAPLTRGRAGKSRIGNNHMAEYYSQRASAGLIISEATSISEEGYGWFGAPGLYTKEQADGWKLSVDAVHAKGGRIFAQLWHMGRQAHSSFNQKGRIVSASAIKVPGNGKIRDANQIEQPQEVPHALTEEEIKATIEDYKKGAILAKHAGFDGIEVHGANGYLIDQFLQSTSNTRTDGYGGSIPNRIKFLLEVIDSVTQVYPASRVGVRLSPNGVHGGMGSADNHETFIEVAKQLSRYGLAYLHVMDGLGFGFHKKCDPVTLYDMKKHFNGPIIGNVGFTKESAEGVIRSGACDYVAFGRPYIANPDLVERFKNDWPLEPQAPMNVWYGRDADPSKCLEGYTTYKPHQPQ